MVKQQTWQDRLCLTIQEAARALHLSPQTIYNLMDREGLPSVHFGKARRVPIDSLRDWLKQREEAQRSS